jgi:hypothetical protein
MAASNHSTGTPNVAATVRAFTTNSCPRGAQNSRPARIAILPRHSCRITTPSCVPLGGHAGTHSRFCELRDPAHNVLFMFHYPADSVSFSHSPLGGGEGAVRFASVPSAESKDQFSREISSSSSQLSVRNRSACLGCFAWLCARTGSESSFAGTRILAIGSQPAESALHAAKRAGSASKSPPPTHSAFATKSFPLGAVAGTSSQKSGHAAGAEARNRTPHADYPASAARSRVG